VSLSLDMAGLGMWARGASAVEVHTACSQDNSVMDGLG
jgi:hypothetical protein